ncbi:hypothetical protein ACIBPB_27140 [Micromonospora sp. NPDC049836]|uniref:hypothetical protein n=1 Tax=Micromonospora sp. NPDC049836 TaxID=3364274 RepID=UPI0037A0967E
MTAPPWSSVAPSQPVERPADPRPEIVDEDDQDEQPGVALAGPGPEEPGETDEAGRRALPVYDELLEFPETQQPAPAAYPENGVWPAVPAPFHQPPAYPMVAEPEPERDGRSRTAVAVVVGVVVLVVVVAVGVGALVLNRGSAPPPGPAPASSAPGPKVSGPPPGDLRLRDDTTTITVTWTDPSDGGVPFVVAGGRAGQKLGVMATVDPGTTRYTVNGLSAKLDYCFTVLAVYSTDTYATSGQVCTAREGGPTN